ncbi:MAG TPA: UDPGP type 1 family protein [Phycisphaerae bacterium]|nr:UDPGP type 1 family protein [Phycisphaerae bacterium]
MSKGQRSELLGDLEGLPFEELPALAKLATSPPSGTLPDAILPAGMTGHSAISGDELERGRSLISSGRLAAFTVAGGQGTRLGFEGPKGAFAISPVRGKTLFQLFAEQIQATQSRYGCRIPWYIMTSPSNDGATRQFFREHSNFSLQDEDVLFFQQGVVPAFDRDGKILLDQPHRLSLAPDGHGGSLLALARSGMLKDMGRRGIEIISYFQVDNPLVICIDPRMIGLHDARRSEMSSKAVRKADDMERVGNFVVSRGKFSVIEYSDLPESLAREKNQDGSRKFDAANIAIHVLSRQFVERLTADAGRFALPWHRAEKKVPFVDLKSGQRIEPASPNGIKLEAFIFDALPLAANPVLMETSRAEEFSPVKNATGVDSVETARRDMTRRAGHWLEAAGWNVPRRPDGEIDGDVEISPLIGLDCADFAAHGPPPRPMTPGEALYLE